MKEFNLDPLIAEEILLPSFKPKVERRGDALYVILHYPALHTSEHQHEVEVDFLVGKDFLITTRYATIDPLHSFAKAFEADIVLGVDGMATHGGHLFIGMTKSLYRSLINECDTIRHRLRTVEDHIFKGEERRMVARISQTGRIIHDFRQSLLSHGEMLDSFEPVSARFFGPEFSYYVHDIIGMSERVITRLENLRDSLMELRETNNSLLSTKQNEIMKTLTIMAFVTFPLTLISSLFSMNTKYMPIIGLPGDFYIVIGMMLALATGFFLFFKHKHWL